MNTARKLHHLNAWEPGTRRKIQKVIPTGMTPLDEMLPDGGWPTGALVEIITPDEYTDAFPLVLPALARLSRASGWLCMVSPPHAVRTRAFTHDSVNSSRILQINPHPGRSGLWTVEQMLCSGNCSAVMAWPDCDAGLIARRLAQAAVAGNTSGFLFRQEGLSGHTSKIGLRLKFETSEAGNMVYLLNSAGQQSGEPVFLSW